MMASFYGTERQGNMSCGSLTLQFTIKNLSFGVLALEMAICVTQRLTSGCLCDRLSGPAISSRLREDPVSTLYVSFTLMVLVAKTPTFCNINFLLILITTCHQNKRLLALFKASHCGCSSAYPLSEGYHSEHRL